MPPDVSIHGQEPSATERLHPCQPTGLDSPLFIFSVDYSEVLGSDCVYSRRTDEAVQLERVTVILVKAVYGGDIFVYLDNEVQAEERLRGLVLHGRSASILLPSGVPALALLNKVENDNK